MSDEMAALAERLVIRRKRDGRCVYDEQAKAELVMACGKPGTSVSRLARECGVNSNQLSRWVREHGARQQRAIAVAPDRAQEAFVPVPIRPEPRLPSTPAVSLQARLPNGVVVELRGCDLSQAGQWIEALGSLRCSASTKA